MSSRTICVMGRLLDQDDGLGVYGLLGRDIVLREPPYHLWEFRPRPLSRLAASTGLDPVEIRQSKIPPGRAYGRKTALQASVMSLVDAVNLPWTRAFNARGDRLTLVARKPGPAPDAPTPRSSRG